MNKQPSFRIHPLIAAVVAVGVFFVALFAIYGLNRWVSAGEVMGRVNVAEVELGGKSEAEAFNAVSAMEIGRLAREAHFVVDGESVDLAPGYTGLNLDVDKAVSEAMAVGRTGNFANQFLHWLSHIFATTHIEIEGTLNSEAVDELFDEWDSEVISKPINLGSVVLEEGQLVAVYPSTGVGIDRPPAEIILLDTLLAAENIATELPTVTVEPELANADVDAALAEAEQMLSAPITMTYDGDRTTVEVDQLKGAFKSETVVNSPPHIVNSFDPAVIDTYLEPLRARFESEPVNARFRINDDNTVSVIPGAKGTRIDETETASRLYLASLSESRTGELPVVEGADPDLTTEYLESLKVEHLVSQFTTFHACCAPRVDNIHLIADAVDGALILPGQTFSLNGYVGERTEEKGYQQAPSIVAGEIVDTLGGGTSQFTTTMYNAVYWGGYQDVEHQPHSYYFDRYPEGIEATLFWESVDLKFRNNREHAILIDTRYTDTSITVRFFGFNHGRTLVGEQSGGETHMRVAAAGGPEALHVKSETSERFDIVEPGGPIFKGNSEVGLNQQRHVQTAQEGWTVRVTRRIFKGGTDLVEEKAWTHRYRSMNDIIEVHPCKVPGTSVACPTTTTTTTQAPTTTKPTTPPSTEPTVPPTDPDSAGG